MIKIFIILVTIFSCKPDKLATRNDDNNQNQEDFNPDNDLDYTKSISLTGQEYKPLNEKIEGLAEIPKEDLAWLPEGITINGDTITWLPMAGDTFKEEKVLDLNGIKTKLSLEIESTDFKKGPPSGYDDESVGYVFVHGKGVNFCESPEELKDYWRNSSTVVAPNPDHLKIVCYDGTKKVAETAESVSNQILEASCGAFDKCIVITHSMGGLMMEHILTHRRESNADDVEPELYDNRELYEKVKNKILFVISIASAAGGSKASELMYDPDDQSAIQGVIGKAFGKYEKNDAAENLLVKYASNVVAPMNEDPGVPFLMVPGFSNEQIDALGDLLGTSSTKEYHVFNGDKDIAALDKLVSYHSRSDGLVSFRGACGIADDDYEAGPGYSNPLEEQFRYCFESKKKPNHFVWFLSNLNHSRNRWADSTCSADSIPCEIYSPDFSKGTFKRNFDLDGRSPTQTIRKLLE